MMASPRSRVPVWAWIVLAAVLIFDVWYRCHTVGPMVRERLGVSLWPMIKGTTEPLDCDEAAYAYIGRRIAGGAVMYRDLTENKPPGGYWIYTLAVAIGGANELTIRLMPIPMVLATIALVWWIALRLRGPGAACAAAAIFAVASTDPYVFGNGANLEHAMNLFATASLALMIIGVEGGPRLAILAAGACLGAACLVKQVAIVHLPVYVGAVLVTSGIGRSVKTRLADIVALGIGFAAVWGLAACILLLQGAGSAAFDDIVRYGGALATDTPPEPHAPPFLVRWITGNADPDGRLPWPFGATEYLVWWGAGTWPLWLAAIPCVGWMLVSPESSASRRLTAACTVSAWVQVALPGLFWQHYYLLPMPGLCVCVAVALAAASSTVFDRSARGIQVGFAGVAATSLVAAVVMTGVIQVRSYLLVPPEQLTINYKGGRQWVALRSLGHELARRTSNWRDPHLFVWGWQSPLFFYGRFDGVSPHFFADPLLKAHAQDDHPLIRPRIDRIMTDLRAHKPELVFCGDPPFPELRTWLLRNYLRSNLVLKTNDGRGLWIARERYRDFEMQ
jgi:4-amino-4-deoxy-L-arabinose transferase-like glycosyltransferase